VRQFEVYRGDLLLGKILLDGIGNGGQFLAAPDFGAVRALFEEEVRQIDVATDTGRNEHQKRIAMEAADKTQAEIMKYGIRLVEVGANRTIQLIGLTIEGERAYWR
jgi:hypothetical protein